MDDPQAVSRLAETPGLQNLDNRTLDSHVAIRVAGPGDGSSTAAP